MQVIPIDMPPFLNEDRENKLKTILELITGLLRVNGPITKVGIAPADYPHENQTPLNEYVLSVARDLNISETRKMLRSIKQFCKGMLFEKLPAGKNRAVQ
jgi:hypothetical protein